MKVAIIGGGITGLSIAYYLSKENIDVTLFESEGELGGITGAFNDFGFQVDKYFHHFFRSDRYLLKLIQELGLQQDIIWSESKMSLLYKNKVYPFSTPFDLLRFPHFNIIDKMRFGLSVFYTKTKSWRSIENVSAVNYMKKIAGKKVCSLLWQPLLNVKFGDAAEQISAAWIWGRFRSRANSRGKFLSKEVLGYLNGSFQKLITAMEVDLSKTVTIHKKTRVQKVRTTKSGKISVSVKTKRNEYDKVVFAIHNPQVIAITDLPKSTVTQLNKIRYQCALCLVINTRKPISKTYWTNIVDSKAFGGMVEHTNFIPNRRRNNYITYLFDYVSPDSDAYKQSNAKILNKYTNELQQTFMFDNKNIKQYKLFREKHATPIYVKNYSKIKPKVKLYNNMYLANTSIIYPDDRDLNNSIKLAKKISNQILNDITQNVSC
ncbi:NAD(P)/FAD-dependent oxidoreductase [Candidatus Woesearchaeota archaeon]|jgi:protoporphyrinogen oxidase|nr:NAD(P)/FAD-dependent oxidoreductase [Candidatus Woesearchaeota archaeon]MBT4114137.1 NAD(P)/FAD-dependent oxidoreductase [Candidatus Woesearchaeota archaeon]MBT4248420.1 NAD(P)/FAD-dependent oxidoreductase [Candidatus Woesearchaeota archaeon]